MAIHTIKIDLDPETGNFSYYDGDGEDGSQLFATRRDTIRWVCNYPWAVNFGSSTPCNRTQCSGEGASLSVRPRAPTGAFKYFVAVALNEQVFTDDPEVVVDPEE